jgi:hypothetical protein
VWCYRSASHTISQTKTLLDIGIIVGATSILLKSPQLAFADTTDKVQASVPSTIYVMCDSSGNLVFPSTTETQITNNSSGDISLDSIGATVYGDFAVGGVNASGVAQSANNFNYTMTNSTSGAV